jgi:hypothetical protein
LEIKDLWKLFECGSRAALRWAFEALYTPQVMHTGMPMRPSRFKPIRSLAALLTALSPLFLLGGCVNDAASYAVNNDRDHAVIVRLTQDYFWSKQASLSVLAARLPDCQRRFDFGKVSLTDLNIELFSTGDETYLLRAGDDMWQIETNNCTQLPPPGENVQAQPIGVFHLDDKKNLVFEKAEGAPGT